MKKIVFLRTNPNAVGGAEHYLSRLMETLKQTGIKTELRFFSGKKWLSSWIKALIFNYQVSKKKLDNELYFSLERIDSADIYRAGDGVHLIYRATKKFWFLNPLNFVYVYLEKRCFKNSSLIIANSNMIKDQIVSNYKVDPNKIKVIYNGVKLPIDIDKIDAKHNLCNELKISFDLPIVLFVGSGFKRKGVWELLDLLSQLKVHVNTIIIGKDKKIEKYKKRADDLGLCNIKFLGERKDVNKFYEAADVFIFPTNYEPFSNVILEAASYGCVCYTTRQNGASEILPDRCVMKDSSDSSILEHIVYLISDKIALKDAQNKARDIALNFSIEKNASLSIKAVKELLSTSMIK